MTDLKAAGKAVNDAELAALNTAKTALDTCRAALADALGAFDGTGFQSEVARVIRETRDGLDYPGNSRIPEMIRQREPKTETTE